MNSHARLLKLGLDRHPVFATRLLQAYASLPPSDSLTCAHRLFDQVPSRARDPSLWTALISAYARSPRPFVALQILALSPSPPSHFAFASAARAVAATADLSLAGTLHAQVLRRGFLSNVVVATSVVDMYSKCGDLGSSRELFDDMPQRNRVTWNSMIAGYATAGLGLKALKLFSQMRFVESELGTDEFTMASSLTACAGISDLRSGRQIHGHLLKSGLGSDSAVLNAVANMYFRCGDVECAERAMEGGEESLMSKLMMIKGFVSNGRYDKALRCVCYHVGGFVELFMMDQSVVVSILTACANLGLLKIGRQVHGLIVTLGFCENFYSYNVDSVVLGSALIDMYCKCFSVSEALCFFNNLLERNVAHWNSIITGCVHNGLVEEARCFFDEVPNKNVITWTAMITGYVQHGSPHEGLSLLARLYGEGGCVRGNCFTFATALNACSCLPALDSGKQIHAQALRTIGDGGENNVVIETALVDMYSKSGCLNYAERVFDRMGNKNIVSWTSMITGYAAHGLGSQAIELLEGMISMGLEPNEVTFVAVLSACSHCGLVDQGIQYFNLMSEKYGIAPSSDHYTCMVDMLGRAGKLVEAEKLLEEVKAAGADYSRGTSIWGALLAGCGLHGSVEIGSELAKKMVERNQLTSDTYVTLSNVYAAAGKWNEVYMIREEWRKQGVVGDPGQSQIQAGVVA